MIEGQLGESRAIAKTKNPAPANCADVGFLFAMAGGLSGSGLFTNVSARAR
jgi:hypothetical protein